MGNQGIQITGFKEFRAQLKAMDSDTPRMVKAVFNVSAELVTAAAKRRAPVRTGRLRDSIRVASTTTRAQIREGGGGVDYAGATDYGNVRKAGRGVGRRDSGGLKFIPTGRIMYPAFLAMEAQVRAEMAQGLTDLARSKGVGVNTSGNE